MAIAFVQSIKCDPSTFPIFSIVSSSFSSTTGNLIVVAIRGFGGDVSSITDTANNTYVPAVIDNSGDPELYIYYTENITGNSTNVVVVNFGASVVYSWAYIVEYSGVATSSSLDVASSVHRTGTTDITSDVFSTSQSGEVIVLAASQNDYTVFSAGTDFTLRDGNIGSDGGFHFGGYEDYITSTQLTSYTAHFTSSDTDNATAVYASFKPASSITNISKAAADSISLDDFFALLLTGFFNINDSVSLVDTNGREMAAALLLNDQITLSEAVAALIPLGFSTEDIISLSDVAFPNLYLLLDFSDSDTLSDSISVLVRDLTLQKIPYHQLIRGLRGL